MYSSQTDPVGELKRSDSMSDATSILNAIADGCPEAAGQLLNVVYEELHRVAACKMAREAPGHTLQPTALVHEAWLRLVGDRPQRFENRRHFLSAAAEAMRRILIDRARRRRCERHGGRYQRVNFEDDMLPTANDDDHLLSLDEALEKLAIKYPLQAQVVKLRYFGGMTNEEIGQLMDISVSTVKNYWAFSKAWLFQEIKKA